MSSRRKVLETSWYLDIHYEGGDTKMCAKLRKCQERKVHAYISKHISALDHQTSVYQVRIVVRSAGSSEPSVGMKQRTFAFRATMLKSIISARVQRTCSGAYSPSKFCSSSSIIHSANFPTSTLSHRASRRGLDNNREIALRRRVRCGQRQATE